MPLPLILYKGILLFFRALVSKIKSRIFSKLKRMRFDGPILWVHYFKSVMVIGISVLTFT